MKKKKEKKITYKKLRNDNWDPKMLENKMTNLGDEENKNSLQLQ